MQCEFSWVNKLNIEAFIYEKLFIYVMIESQLQETILSNLAAKHKFNYVLEHG